MSFMSQQETFVAGSEETFYMQTRHPETASTPRPGRKPVGKSRVSVPGNKGTKIELATTINRSPEELFAFWRNFENLPQVMDHVESVECMDQNRSHWRARSGDKRIEWDAEIINEKRNEMIAWRSLEGSDVHHAGSIWFKPAPGELGTEVKLSIEYSVGSFTDTVAKLLRRSPEQQMREDLRHFKQMMEAGEIPTTAGQSSGRDKDKTDNYVEAK
jgi:uncharacterized membrane protein